MDICGYAGNILYIDLTSSKVRTEKLDPELIKSFIGGYGISNKLAYDLIPPDVDPLSPENRIIIGTGVFAGTIVPGAAKVLFTTKFPINNAFATAAGGGHFAWMLKSNGYDYAIIGGQASHPVYLNITENGAEICDASHLWGKDIFETVDELRDIYQQSSIIPISPAGENLVKISITSIDKAGTIGSGGLPAVMGSKKLKAIVVQQGNKTISVAHPVKFMRLVNTLHERILQWTGRETFLKHGNTHIPEAINPTDRATMTEMHAQSRKLLACASCPLAEKEIVKIEESAGRSLTTYVTHFSARKFGADSATAEFAREAKYQDAINRYGLCTHQFLNVVNFMVYLYQNGIISKKDTDGIELNGDYDTVMNLIQLTAYRKGLGDLLAEGAAGAARRIGRGAEAYAVHIKGRAIVGDPRLSSLGTMEFEQITTPRGSHFAAGGSPSFSPGRTLKDFERHSERMGVPEETIKRIVGATSFNPGRLSRYSEDWYSLFNCLSLCNRAWVNRFYHIKTITELYSATTGIEASPAELMRSAERAWTLYKLLNVRAGFSRKDDKAPAAWFESVRTGDIEYVMTDYYKTKTLTKQDIESLLDDYYDERGWDIKTGLPTPQKLRELGLCDEAPHYKQE